MLTKSKLKVGDRVATYWTKSPEQFNRQVGTVKEIGPNGIVTVEYGPGDKDYFHAKQCRRLRFKPKPLTLFIAADSIPADDSCAFHACVAGPEYVAEQRRRGSKAIWHEFKEVVSVKERTDGT